MVVQDLITKLNLKNVRATAVRAEEHQEKYDFVTCRAVASLDKLYHWTLRRIKHKHQNGIPNGLIALKGGRLKEEIKALPKGVYTETFPITDFFDFPYFEEKVILYLQH